MDLKDQIREQALKLPKDELQGLVAELNEYLISDNSSQLEAAWEKELLKRKKAHKEGHSKPIPWSELRSKLQETIDGAAS
ncbi:MAG: addiction module protein [Planctomycetota bacterium]|nr:addiction module protein [Planctomycetota bacterium]